MCKSSNIWLGVVRTMCRQLRIWFYCAMVAAIVCVCRSSNKRCRLSFRLLHQSQTRERRSSYLSLGVIRPVVRKYCRGSVYICIHAWLSKSSVLWQFTFSTNSLFPVQYQHIPQVFLNRNTTDRCLLFYFSGCFEV